MIADPQRLLDNAVAFHEAGTRCYREEPAKISADGTDVFLGAPSVVCYAFAIELYLKLLSLLTKDSYDKREHRLDLLFAQLDAPLQAQIERHYSGGQPLADLTSGRSFTTRQRPSSTGATCMSTSISKSALRRSRQSGLLCTRPSEMLPRTW